MLSLSCLPGFSSIPASCVCKQVVWIQPGTYTSTYYAAMRMHIVRFIKYTVLCFVFFSFSRSVVGTSGLAPRPTSGPLILPVLGKI